MKNMYEGLIEDWKFDLMVRRARVQGIRSSELEDALQEIVGTVIDFKFDPERGCLESTALTAIIDNALRNIRRSEHRRKKNLKQYEKDRAPRPEEGWQNVWGTERSLDLQMIYNKLAPFDQKVFNLVTGGSNIQDAADKLDVRWHTVSKAVERIQEAITACGLDQPFPGNARPWASQRTPEDREP